MRQPLTLAQVKSIVAKAAVVPIDPGLFEMMPAELSNYVQSGPDILAAFAALEHLIEQKDEHFNELNLALAEYANQSGGGQMMMDNIRICLEHLRYNKAQGVNQGALNRQGRG